MQEMDGNEMKFKSRLIKHGEERERVGFALFPTRIDEETVVWLERIVLVEWYSADGWDPGWKIIKAKEYEK